jgi:Protein of unknown function (DUF3572)
METMMTRHDAFHDPEALAIDTLGFIAGEPERLERFLAVTGLDPSTLRAAAGAPGFLVAVLDHVLADEALLLSYAANRRLAPEAVALARRRLGGPSAPEA